MINFTTANERLDIRNNKKMKLEERKKEKEELEVKKSG